MAGPKRPYKPGFRCSREGAGLLEEPDVHDDDIGSVEPDLAHCIRHRPDLSHDFYLFLSFEERAQTLPHDLVIVDEEDPQRLVGTHWH